MDGRVVVRILDIVCGGGHSRMLLLLLMLTMSQPLKFPGVFGFESFQGSSRGLEKGTGSLFRHVNNGSWRRCGHSSTTCRRIARLGGLVLTEQLLLLSLKRLGSSIQTNESLHLVEEEEEKGPLEDACGSHGSLYLNIVLVCELSLLRVHLVHDNHE